MNKTLRSPNDNAQAKREDASPKQIARRQSACSPSAPLEPLPVDSPGFSSDIAPRHPFATSGKSKTKLQIDSTLNTLRRAFAGIYLNSFTLKFYDVLQSLCYPLLWHCPRRHIHDLYVKHIGATHLDVGSATGYYINQLKLNPDDIRLTLMGTNVSCLKKSKSDLARFSPSVYEKDICQFIPHVTECFDSINVNNFLQSAPGGYQHKGHCFQHLRRLLNSEGRVFGHVVVAKGANFSPVSLVAMTLFNCFGLYNNRQDSVKDLREALELHFENVVIDVRGAVAIFVAN